MTVETVLKTLLTMSAVSALVIGAVMLLRLVLKKAPKRYAYLLWMVVLLRLLLPAFPKAPVSVVPRVELPVLEQAEQPSASQEQLPPAPKDDLVQGTQSQPAAPAPQPVEEPAAPDFWDIAGIVWLTGVAGMAGYGIVSLALLKRRLVGAVSAEKGVCMADHIDTPFVLGLFRPKIYLPSYLQEAEYILLHERQHIRCGDPLVKTVFYLALCLHWFNPMVWAAFVLMGRDMEMRCDEAVLAQLPGDIRREYATALLNISTGRRRIAPMPLAFGEGDPKRRIKNVLNYRKPHFWVIVLAIIVCIAAVGCMLTDPAGTQNETTPPEETTAPVGTTTAPEETFFVGERLPQPVLNYPGLEWGMTQSEVCAAMGLQASEGRIYGPVNVPEIEEYLPIEFENVPVLGTTAQEISFIFETPQNPSSSTVSQREVLVKQSPGGLRTVMIVFPDDADMAAVKEELIRLYGKPADEYRSPVIEDYRVEEMAFPSDEHCTYWVSTQTFQDYLEEAGLQPSSNLSEAKIEAFISQKPRACIFWSDNGGNKHINHKDADGNVVKNMLCFSAIV